MKRAIHWILGAAFVLSGALTGCAQTPVPQGRVSISGAWALYPMVVKWAEEYQKLYPKVKIDVQAGGAGKGIADALAGMVDFGMVSRDVHPTEIEKGALPFAVTKDAVVPMIHAKNPYLKALLEKGLTQKAFTQIWITKTATTWADVLGGKAPAPIHVFTRSDACGAAETWAAFLGKRQEDLAGVAVYGDPGLADAVRRDPLGIGFNNVNFAYDPKTLVPVAGLVAAPHRPGRERNDRPDGTVLSNAGRPDPGYRRREISLAACPGSLFCLERRADQARGRRLPPLDPERGAKICPGNGLYHAQRR